MANDTNTEDPRQARLTTLLSQRDTLKTDKGRIEGQLVEARKTLTGVEDECKARKVKPDQLDAAIKTLEGRFDTAAEALENDMSEAQGALAPFVEEGTDEDKGGEV